MTPTPTQEAGPADVASAPPAPGRLASRLLQVVTRMQHWQLIGTVSEPSAFDRDVAIAIIELTQAVLTLASTSGQSPEVHQS